MGNIIGSPASGLASIKLPYGLSFYNNILYVSDFTMIKKIEIQLACGVGKYVSGSTCVSCPAGTFQNSATFTGTQCTQCVAGTYSGAGATTCTACSMPTGASAVTSPAGSTSQAACTATSCRAGYFLNSSGQCIQCPAGTSQSSATFTGSSCTSCAVGTYSLVGATTCTTCPVPAGTNAVTSPAGSSNVSQCTATSCGVGRYLNSSGQCIQCPAGTSQNSGSFTGSSCTSCAVGT